MKYLLIVFWIALSATLPAHAQNTAQQLSTRFSAADKDHDGKLTRSEAQAGMPRVASRFDEIDAAGTGYVTLEQIAQHLAKQKR